MNKLRRAVLASSAAIMIATAPAAMSEPFLGQVAVMSVSYCPFGWTEMDGRLLQINQNLGLFSLLGTTYGGDGEDTFALPRAAPEFTASGVALRSCIATIGVYPSE